ncbi:DUF4097 family beta strand repeat-containing protein [Streptomyces clavuligerus]|uniref:DUF4097 domain-containing protein n=1 Tax=Streptomyces clavuligerus TaxID=1901 RepID=E2Q0H4_STRCL|nr:DUF4097 family beta strand repeat-containing protein [Streptomyces clavuligerus]ANW16957.1 hypothetical protein BB341_01285 [Streptomyces clavuligerus]AXU11486.1 hypothetical protein D1794_01360 [Streptomyces clavuligerus]EFG10517.1 Hypothetical protein SCLAV_5450 [Streptomyces clavuligerus]MBY6301305.1 DUF4097 family beta strand repeat protein [Streptomyces clavuligerus]QCS04358.1 hypothetical protein CRV15_01360 [Streptomyces clavuligerus]
MPHFDTPEPISVTLSVDVGAVRITAGDRADTTVEVLPDSGADDADLRVAQQTRVTCENGVLLVKGPRQRSLFGKVGAVSVLIEVPAGSSVRGTASVLDLICEGPLGECRFRTSTGSIRVAEADTAELRTGLGDVTVDRVTGTAEIIGAGRVVVGELGSTATIKNLNGETVIGEADGHLRVNSSNGRISVDVARSGIDARSAQGGIRVGAAAGGPVELQTGAGDLDVGIPRSVTAWLDVNSRLGKVRNALGPAGEPSGSERTVEVRARTSLGDIVIRRA